MFELSNRNCSINLLRLKNKETDISNIYPGNARLLNLNLMA